MEDMEKDQIIKVDHVSMKFNMASEKFDSLKDRYPIMSSGH